MTVDSATRRPPSWAWVSPVAAILLWQLASQVGLIDLRIIVPPLWPATRGGTSVILTLIEMTRHEGLAMHTAVTVGRFLAGLALGAIPGVAVGATMGLFRWARVAFGPLVAAIYPLPHIALFPIVLILLGQNERANLLTISLGPFFILALTTSAGVRAIDPIYRDVARSFGTPLRDLYLRVVLPAALPVVMGGMRVALGTALVSAVAVEFLVAENGVGHIIWNSWQVLSLARCVAGLVVTGAIGLAASWTLGRIERRLIPWQAR